MLNTLFDLSSVGVDGVNIHSLPGAAYEVFTFRRDSGGWQAFVHPDYYGMLMFAQSFPPGAQLLPVHAPSGPVKVWATHGPDGHTRVTLINQDSQPRTVELQLPSAGGPASLEWLRAPGVGRDDRRHAGRAELRRRDVDRKPAGAPAAAGVAAARVVLDRLPAYSAALLRVTVR